MSEQHAQNKDAKALDILSALETSFALSVLNSSPDCIKIIELDGSLSFMNHNGMCAMEIDEFCHVEAKPWPSLWPDAAQDLLQDAVERAREGDTVEFEAYCPTAKGKARWWNVTVAPVRNRNGRVERLLATSRDVTDRILREQRAQEHERQIAEYAAQLASELRAKDKLLAERDLLSREIDHRVKNSLTQVVSMLRLQGRTLGDDQTKAAIDDAARRVATIAKVHELLSTTEGVAEIALRPFLQSLSKDVHSGVGAGDHRLEVEIAETTLKSDVAIPIGLIAAELVSNALKHGCAGRSCSTVSVSFSVSSENAKEFTLKIEDDGPGFKGDAATSDGLGMRICSVYASQLGGSLKSTNGTLGGGCFELTFRAV